MKTWTRRLLLTGGALLAVCCVVCFASFLVLDQPRPTGGEFGDAADAAAREMIASTNPQAWANTGAVTWTYGGRYNHLWDRTRNLVRVRKGDFEAFVDINDRRGTASQAGKALKGKERDEAVDEAWAAWANDSFWLNAPNKVFDPGTSRALWTQDDGSRVLVVHYKGGGVTPGDTYMWHLDPRGRPVAWQMWVSIIPVGGVRATWDGWVQLSTGAWISTVHSIGPVDITLTDLKGARTLAELEPGPDPFAGLIQEVARQRASLVDSAASSESSR